MKNTSNLKNILGLLCLFLVLSCKKQVELPQGHVTATPKVTASASTLELARADTSKTAVTFTWSAGKVDGLTGKLAYILEFDKKGNNFARPNAIKVGGDSLTHAVSVKTLNNLLSDLPVNTPNDVELRVVTATSDGSAAPFFSNVISLKVTTFNPVPFSQLWLIGDATPGGWGLDNLTPLTQSGSDPFLFTYSGPLVAGELKIATARDYNAPIYRPATNHPALTATAVDLSAGDPDNKWLATASVYKITLNLHNQTISISVSSSPTVPYNKLWLVGDATPGGWSLDNATPLKQNGADPFIFTYIGAFTAGEFKIGTAKDFSAPFYRPETNHPDLSATGVKLSAGDPDNKWQVTTPGTYRITLNLHTTTITIVNTANISPPYTKLWLIGDATPGGWSLDSATPMVLSPSNPFLFTYTGAFTAGEFKIGTAKDFNAAFYRPVTDHPDLSATDVQVTAGNPDNKWIVSAATAGNYTVTLNTLDNTISIVKQ